MTQHNGRWKMTGEQRALCQRLADEAENLIKRIQRGVAVKPWHGDVAAIRGLLDALTGDAGAEETP